MPSREVIVPTNKAIEKLHLQEENGLVVVCGPPEEVYSILGKLGFPDPFSRKTLENATYTEGGAWCDFALRDVDPKKADQIFDELNEA